MGVFVGPDIDTGRRLTRALEGPPFSASASLWLYMPEASEWRLVIGTPLVDKKGPIQAYGELQKVLQKEQITLDLRHVSLVSPQDSLIGLLRKALRTGPQMAEVRFTGNTIDNVYIEDAYIYRIS